MLFVKYMIVIFKDLGNFRIKFSNNAYTMFKL